MKTWPTSTEVDYVIIGSGAAGGIMARQLSMAGFSVVVLEQGGWGKYGREHESNKDEWLARNENDDERLMSDPKLQVNTFRPNDKVKAMPGSHSYGRVVGGGTVATYGGACVTCRMNSGKLLTIPRFLRAPPWRTGRSLTKSWNLITRRPNGKWVFRDSA